eukprot:8896890-Alexandrium_andersonii.AAC.1
MGRLVARGGVHSLQLPAGLRRDAARHRPTVEPRLPARERALAVGAARAAARVGGRARAVRPVPEAEEARAAVQRGREAARRRAGEPIPAGQAAARGGD